MCELTTKFKDEKGLSDFNFGVTFLVDVFFVLDWLQLNLAVQSFKRVLFEHVYKLHILLKFNPFVLVVKHFLVREDLLYVLLCYL
jgi:hypothetical protein